MKKTNQINTRNSKKMTKMNKRTRIRILTDLRQIICLDHFIIILKFYI